MSGNTLETERLAEFKAAFSALDDESRDRAVSILRALEFAQSWASAVELTQLNMGVVAV